MENGKTKKKIIKSVKRLVEKKEIRKSCPYRLKFNGEGWWSRFMKDTLSYLCRCQILMTDHDAVALEH